MAVSRTLFDAHLISDLITKAKGRSSLAALSPQIPVAFNGNKEFVFSLDSDIDVVAENGKKTHGGFTLEPITMVPIKVEYGARVSDEFMIASEEEKVDILSAFNDGFAKKLAAGLDKMAMHGINPRTGTASAVIGDNNFDAKVTQTVKFDATKPDDNLEAAIALVEGADGDTSGIVISPTVRTALAARVDSEGNKLYPEFMFGGKPANLGTNTLEINKTVSAAVDGSAVDQALVGDFANMFKWGYGKEVWMDVIEYGDPDNTGNDLKGHNQVYLRCEAYIGWAIFDPDSFARVIA
jgi:HK97 family phage major capsid protein